MASDEKNKRRIDTSIETDICCSISSVKSKDIIYAPTAVYNTSCLKPSLFWTIFKDPTFLCHLNLKQIFSSSFMQYLKIDSLIILHNAQIFALCHYSSNICTG